MKSALQVPAIALGLITVLSLQTWANQKGPLVKAGPQVSLKNGASASVTLKGAAPALPQNLKDQIKPRFAGPGSSGGGNALVCFNSAQAVKEIHANGSYISDKYLKDINFIETFDLYEAKKKRGFSETDSSTNLIEIKSNESIAAYAKRVINRIKPHYPEFHSLLEREYNQVASQRSIQTDDRIDQVFDINPDTFVDKPNCLFATLAAQINEKDMTTIYIDNKLFNHPRHSRESKGALLIHEAVYSLLRKEWKHSDSRSTRFVVAALLNSETRIRDLNLVIDSILDLTPNSATKSNYLLADKEPKARAKVVSEIIMRAYPNSEYVRVKYNYGGFGQLGSSVLTLGGQLNCAPADCDKLTANLEKELYDKHIYSDSLIESAKPEFLQELMQISLQDQKTVKQILKSSIGLRFESVKLTDQIVKWIAYIYISESSLGSYLKPNPNALIPVLE